MNINIKIIFHGSLKKYNNNRSEIEMNMIDGTTIGQLISNTEVPKEEIAFVAVNGSRSALTQKLQEGDEVKLFQLVGGG
jgi:sulfur carrier protein ThiS